MSQATLSDGPYRNSNLFSNHYLDERLKGRDEWDCDDEAREAMDDLQALYELEGELVESYGEDALIDNWIDEVLDILGFGTQEEVTLPAGGGFVDELLFESPTARRDAAGVYLKTKDTTDLFERGIGIVEAKQWDAAFDVQFSEQRPYRNASHQTKHYLENTPPNIQWGVLTNGRKWRLYGTNDYETQTYYEVDLPELLERGDLEAFKYFYVFFQPAAFHESGGTTFHDEVWSESETASQELGENLQDNVFTALRVLGRGFIETNDDLDIDADDEEALDELKEQSLVFLYRLMFVLYAESRRLIHPEDQSAQDEYDQNFSLDELRLNIHDTLGEVDEGFENEFSEYSTTMWSRLEDLFRLIDEGEENLGIPPYNGGLFDHEEHDFLTEHEVSNQYLAEVIYRLSTTQNDEGRYVLADYGDLDTRHLGSVYEGLLEHQFRIAPEQYAAVTEDGGQVWKSATEVSVADAVETVPKDGLYVVNDEGERKATGAYYTPDYVVTYIVEETVGPLIEEIRENLIEQGFEPGTQEYIEPFFRRVTELRILDPAMGSGHFLTKATGYLSEQVMAEVREAETEFGVAFDEQHIRREIAKECIHGVDLNGMAVELAKLSMWLETLAADRPLAFLDHHLKQGNSLVGSDIEAIEELESDANGDGQQASLAEFGATREGTIERLMDIYSEFLAIENETVEDVREMKRKYAEIEQDELRQRLIAMADVYTAERFGLDVPGGAYEQMARSLEDDGEWDAVKDTAWFESARKIADQQEFFHWELEFPSAFYDENGERNEDSGFDVVLGNPPWLNAWTMTEKMPELRDAIKNLFSHTEILSGHWDFYVPFIAKSLELCKSDGNHSFILPNTVLTEKYTKELRKHFLEKEDINSILDFGERDVFENVDRQVVVYNITRSAPSGEHSLRVCRGVSPFIYDEIERASSDMWLEVYNFQIRINKSYISDSLPLIEKIDDSTTRLGNYLYVNVGATVSSKESGKFSKDDVISKSPEGNAKRFFQGTDVNRWSINWPGEWLDYRQDEMSGPRTPEMFEAEKIALRVRTDEGGVLAAGYDNEGMYCDHTVLVCCDYEVLEGTNATIDFDGFNRSNNDFELRYLLALINSSLMTWVFKNKFETGGLQGSYSDVWPQSVRSFPIPEDINHKTPFSTWKDRAANILDEEDRIETAADIQALLSILVDAVMERRDERENINLELIDYLGDYQEGKSLSDLSAVPPEGRGKSLLVKKDGESEKFETIRGTESVVEREGNSLTIKLVPYVKPKQEYIDEYDTNSYGYATLDPIPALRFNSIDESLAILIEEFVPYAVNQANGFAGYRDDAIDSKSLIHRLGELTLPDRDDIAEELHQYREQRERAEYLEREIEGTDQLIDDIVYELYGLTDEEIDIVEKAVTDD
jgi:type I restriction-modification system DNA methylase subunit